MPRGDVGLERGRCCSSFSYKVILIIYIKQKKSVIKIAVNYGVLHDCNFNNKNFYKRALPLCFDVIFVALHGFLVHPLLFT